MLLIFTEVTKMINEELKNYILSNYPELSNWLDKQVSYHQDDEGNTLLHKAVQANDAQLVKLVLSASPSTKINNDGKTQAQLAIDNGNSTILHLLCPFLSELENLLISVENTNSFNEMLNDYTGYEEHQISDGYHSQQLALLVSSSYDHNSNSLALNAENIKFIAVHKDFFVQLLIRRTSPTNDETREISIDLQGDFNLKYSEEIKYIVSNVHPTKIVIKDADNDQVEIDSLLQFIELYTKFELDNKVHLGKDLYPFFTDNYHQDSEGNTLLHKAVATNDEQLIKLVLKTNPIIKANNSGKTAMQLAIDNGNSVALHLLCPFLLQLENFLLSIQNSSDFARILNDYNGYSESPISDGYHTQQLAQLISSSYDNNSNSLTLKAENIKLIAAYKEFFVLLLVSKEVTNEITKIIKIDHSELGIKDYKLIEYFITNVSPSKIITSGENVFSDSELFSIGSLIPKVKISSSEEEASGNNIATDFSYMNWVVSEEITPYQESSNKIGTTLNNFWKTNKEQINRSHGTASKAWVVDRKIYREGESSIIKVQNKDNFYATINEKTLGKLGDVITQKQMFEALKKGEVKKHQGQNGIKWIKDNLIELKINSDTRLIASDIYKNPDGQYLIIFDQIANHAKVKDKSSHSQIKVNMVASSVDRVNIFDEEEILNKLETLAIAHLLEQEPEQNVADEVNITGSDAGPSASA
jgi:ankyrin repeat protein